MIRIVLHSGRGHFSSSWTILSSSRDDLELAQANDRDATSNDWRLICSASIGSRRAASRSRL